MSIDLAQSAPERVRAIPSHLPFIEQLYFLGRPFNATLPLVLSLCGYYLATGAVTPIDSSVYTLFVCMFLIHAGFTILNDIADRAIDRDNSVRTRITTGTLRQVKQLGYGAAGIIAVGIAIAITLPPTTFGAIILTVLLSFCYNHRPLQLSRRPIGSIVTLGILYGLLPLFAGYFLVASHLTPALLFLGLFWLVGRMSLSLLKDFKDSAGDAKHHKQTFLLRYGPSTTLRLSVIGGIVGYVGIALVICSLADSTMAQIASIATLFAVGVLFIYQRLKLLAPHSNIDMLFDRLTVLQLFVDGVSLAWLMVL